MAILSSGNVAGGSFPVLRHSSSHSTCEAATIDVSFATRLNCPFHSVVVAEFSCIALVCADVVPNEVHAANTANNPVSEISRRITWLNSKILFGFHGQRRHNFTSKVQHQFSPNSLGILREYNLSLSLSA